MSFLSRIMSALVGEADSTDIESTRTRAETTFRLPPQFPGWNVRLPMLIILVGLGVYGIFLVISGTLRFAADPRNYLCMAISVVLIACTVVLVFVRTRFGWHYEISLTSSELCAYYVTLAQRYCIARMDMTPVRQLTIVRKGSKSLLQAEAADDTVRLILREQKHDVLVRLANALAGEFASFTQRLLKIAVEDPDQLVPERETAPLACKIVLVRHETGVALDFPLTSDARDGARRRAWRTFEVGVLTLLGTVIVYALGAFLQRPELLPFLVIPFVAGLIYLISASGQGWKAWQEHAGDAELRQLSVAGNMLIRTARDHSKQIWYREEIRAIDVVERVLQTTSTSSEGTVDAATSKFLEVRLALLDGKDVVLREIDAATAQADYRCKAELEWIATELRRALFQEATETPPFTPDETAHSIVDRAAHAKDTHVTK